MTEATQSLTFKPTGYNLVTVRDTIFREITNNGNNIGVISIWKSNNNEVQATAEIEDCSFISCIGLDVGCIVLDYFDSKSNSSIVKICTYNCSTTSPTEHRCCHFLRASGVVEYNSSSIYVCRNQVANEYSYLMHMIKYAYSSSYINCSECLTNSSFGFDSISGVKINYHQFKSNEATIIYSTCDQTLISTSNFINNSASDNYLIICSTATIEESYFADYSKVAKATSSITFNKCFFDAFTPTFEGTVKTQNIEAMTPIEIDSYMTFTCYMTIPTPPRTYPPEGCPADKIQNKNMIKPRTLYAFTTLEIADYI